MKDARWLIVIGALNLAVAGAVILWRPAWAPPHAPFQFTPFFLFRIALATLAAGTALGLWLRKDRARRWSIVLWTIVMILAIPVAMLGGIRFGVAGVVAGLGAAIGLPMLVISYLSRPEVKAAVGAPDPTYSGKKTIAFVLAGMFMGLALIALFGYEVLSAIGRGLR